MTTQETMNKMLELFFEQKNVLYEHVFSSYDQLIRKIIPYSLIQETNFFHEAIDREKIYLHGFKCYNISIKPSTTNNDNEIQYPRDTRKNHLNYFAAIIADVQQIVEIHNTVTGDKTIMNIGDIEKQTPIANIPVMVKSRYCSTTIKQDLKGECKYDPGGYFIVNGAEKALLSIEIMCYNKIFVFPKKDASYPKGLQYIAQINSKLNDWSDNLQILTIKYKKNGVLTLNTSSQLVDIPIFILFRALGIESDQKIISYITYNLNDTKMINLIRPSVMLCTDELGVPIKTKEEAIEYLITKLRRNKRISQTDENIAKIQKKLYLDKLLRHDLLPNLKEDIPKKILFLGLMCNQLLNVMMGNRDFDDRDALHNKRIEPPGILLSQLFRQNWKKMLSEIGKNFSKKNQSNDKPLNVINQIKPSIIEQGIKTALSTGVWGMMKTKKGVAQALQRLSWIQSISYLRRIMSPSMGDSTSKVISIRKVNTNQAQMLCLTGDTQVLTTNYNVIEIKDIVDGHEVVTFSSELNETPSYMFNKFCKLADNLLKITTSSGRMIKATSEHKFKVVDDNMVVWKEACNIKQGEHIMIRPTEIILKYEEMKCPLDLPFNKLLVISRLFGLLHGYNNKQIFSFNTLDDLNLFINDIKILGFENCIVITYNTQYDVRAIKELSNILLLLGLSNRIIPDWLMNGNKMLKREYLSGLLSASGNMIIGESITDIYIKLTNKNILYFHDMSLTDSNIFMNRITDMLNEFNIITTNHPMGNNGGIDYIGIVINNTIANMNRYCDIIGFRYNENNRKKSSIVIEYLRTVVEKSIPNTNDTSPLYYREAPLSFEIFKAKHEMNNGYVSIDVINIEKINPEFVYDFTTISNNHSFIASSFCSSNCPIDTPEGANIGVVKSLAMTSTITMQNLAQIDVLETLLKPNPHIKHPYDIDPLTMREYVKIFINGSWHSVIKLMHGVDIYNYLKQKRREGIIDRFTTILLDINMKEIRIFIDGGRLIRPLVIVNKNNINISKELINDIEIELKKTDKSTSWNRILDKYNDFIEYEDIETLNHLLVCNDINKLTDNKMVSQKVIGISQNDINRHGDTKWINYTHCDFHQWTLMGIVACNIPFSNHNYGNRNIIHFSQAKQSIGIYLSSYKDRIDISQILYNPQVPLVQTQGMKYNGCLDLPYGENAIVAICSYTGFNQEDSIIFNQSAIDRGIFRADTLKKESSEIEKNPSTSQDDIFTKPDMNKVAGMKHGSYEKLNDKGYVPEEVEINNDDIIIGKISPIQPTGTNNKIYKDNSKIFKSSIPGVIDRVHTGIHTAEGYEMYNMRIRLERKPIIGDKFSSRHSQKGTIGIVYPQRDMPFTESGIVPDLLLNPQGFPTRMSVAHFIETLAAKVASITGEFVDGTPFNNYDIKQLPIMLKKLGYSEHGTEVMYCGITGKKMEAEIFIGPSYNLRLKHMVQDKEHGRARGPRQFLTRQPLEGRSKDGGLKIGEMERDAMIAHGMGQFTKERLMETSDITKIYVCDDCGQFASKIIDRDYYKCKGCQNSTRISPVVIPYACKLLFQELTSVNILPRIKTK
jgi:DNA-directed RNA polymerase beta subunit/intein/homing endonuclease